MFKDLQPFEIEQMSARVSTMDLKEVFEDLEASKDKASTLIEKRLPSLRGDSSLVAARFTGLGVLQQKYWEYCCSKLKCTKFPTSENPYISFKASSGEELTFLAVPLKMTSNGNCIQLVASVEVGDLEDPKERILRSEYATLISQLDAKASNLGLDYLSTWPNSGSFSLRPELLLASSIVGVTEHLKSLNSLGGIVQNPDSNDLYLVIAPSDQISLQAKMIENSELAIKFISASFIDLCAQLGDFCLPQDIFLALGEQFALEIKDNSACQITLRTPNSNSRNRKEIALEGDFWHNSHSLKEEYHLRIDTDTRKSQYLKFTCTPNLNAVTTI